MSNRKNPLKHNLFPMVKVPLDHITAEMKKNGTYREPTGMEKEALDLTNEIWLHGFAVRKKADR